MSVHVYPLVNIIHSHILTIIWYGNSVENFLCSIMFQNHHTFEEYMYMYMYMCMYMIFDSEFILCHFSPESERGSVSVFSFGPTY